MPWDPIDVHLGKAVAAQLVATFHGEQMRGAVKFQLLHPLVNLDDLTEIDDMKSIETSLCTVELTTIFCCISVLRSSTSDLRRQDPDSISAANSDIWRMHSRRVIDRLETYR